MRKTNILYVLIAFVSTFFLSAQTKILKGQLIANDEVEGLHILNKTAAKYAISKEDGSFLILAKVSDTLYVTGLKYKKQDYIITQSIMDLGSFSVQLIEEINELKQVVVGKILTGSLESDIENSDAKPEINFYDLGIPGNTDLPLTQNEQRLYDADHGQFAYYYGIAVVINVHKILNRINGDTKEYKERVKIESNEKCINRLKSEYSNTIFESISIPENDKEEFFQFCLEDDQFSAVCENENQLNAVGFLLEKLKIFKKRLNEED